ncbi:MAG: 3-phosphoglycerate dehydrogenase family protein [Spirochaetaceae bacterium]|jgi:D-3-phosphoglycerate dehydrogenase|nr:3-phosphoglycerate dehydrogenase family protein [Spirochaetaceae bacterium]
MYKIKLLNKISTKGLDLLDRENYEAASEISTPDAILVRSTKMHDMELPSSLKAIGRAGAGVNNIPIDKCSEKGIVVFNTPGANANSVKELVLAGMLLCSRDIIGAINWVNTQKDQGDEVPRLIEKEKSKFGGPELKGKTMGVIGLGAIGVLVANAASSLGMNVIGYDPFISVDAAWGLSREIKKASGLDSLLTKSDYISLHIPLNDKTRGLINKEKIELLKNNVRIMNFARGGLINEEDLLLALEQGKVGAYVSDFPEASLLGKKGVIAIPHLGASTPEAEENCAVMAVEQVKDFLVNGNITNSVNFPNCIMENTGVARLIIANKNIPDMLSQILKVISNAGINVQDMTNRHRNDLAYNIIDVDSREVPPSLIEDIKNIQGVLMTRLILTA